MAEEGRPPAAAETGGVNLSARGRHGHGDGDREYVGMSDRHAVRRGPPLEVPEAIQLRLAAAQRAAEAKRALRGGRGRLQRQLKGAVPELFTAQKHTGTVGRGRQRGGRRDSCRLCSGRCSSRCSLRITLAALGTSGSGCGGLGTGTGSLRCACGGRRTLGAAPLPAGAPSACRATRRYSRHHRPVGEAEAPLSAARGVRELHHTHTGVVSCEGYGDAGRRQRILDCHDLRCGLSHHRSHGEAAQHLSGGGLSLQRVGVAVVPGRPLSRLAGALPPDALPASPAAAVAGAGAGAGCCGIVVVSGLYVRVRAPALRGGTSIVGGALQQGLLMTGVSVTALSLSLRRSAARSCGRTRGGSSAGGWAKQTATAGCGGWGRL